MDDRLKNTIKHNKISFGSWITLGHNSIPEIMSSGKFDWFVIDLEHSVIDIKQAQRLIQIIELTGAVPLVRVTSNNADIIKRVMDAGACGVLVPMIKSKADAMNAVKAVKYPPIGTRSVGLARAQGYGKNFDQYKSWINKSSIVIVQIEHIDAVEHIDEILSIPEVDGYIIGPYDLSASLGIPGELNNTKVLSAEKKIMEASKKYSKAAGIHVVQPDTKLVLDKIHMGYTFMAIGTDFLFLGNACETIMKEIKKELS